MPPARPASAEALLASTDFDIVETYNNLLMSDPALTKPVAAIHALIALLNSVSITTIHETVETLKAHAKRLKNSVTIPAPITAGTDLFIQFLISSLNQPGGDFDALLQHLLQNGRLFAHRAIAAREGVAERGFKYIGEGKTLLTLGASRCVTALLQVAVERRGGGPMFRVVYVRDDNRKAENDAVVAKLRRLGIPVAEVAMSSVAHVMGLLHQVDTVIVGAEAVAENGGIISRMGTYQIAKLAYCNRPKLPFYVATETHKFSRDFPLGQRDIDQKVLDFSTQAPSKQPKDAVDYTPPEFITGLITETGTHLPSYVPMKLLETYDDSLFTD
ncbi:hypothetical protein CDD82_3501 [Ophiocordyceps australis]|uniref:Translation initiation factor eIF2B subunit alpha n=1 Tax=Ophiocordyceps australis TaxID=1399860 RepID=A0A2C5YH94_9HYPO|nr:hypothetical protein CDD82_3501 [Ophiocordyceps australis]